MSGVNEALLEACLGDLVEAEFVWSHKNNKSIRLHKIIYDIREVFADFGYLTPEQIGELLVKQAENGAQAKNER